MLETRSTSGSVNYKKERKAIIGMVETSQHSYNYLENQKKEQVD